MTEPTQYTPSENLLTALEELKEAQTTLDEKRKAAYAAMAQDMKEYRVPQTKMAQHVPWTEEHVRTIAREYGVPRLKTAKKTSVPAKKER